MTVRLHIVQKMKIKNTLNFQKIKCCKKKIVWNLLKTSWLKHNLHVLCHKHLWLTPWQIIKTKLWNISWKMLWQWYISILLNMCNYQMRWTFKRMKNSNKVNSFKIKKGLLNSIRVTSLDEILNRKVTKLTTSHINRNHQFLGKKQETKTKFC